MGGGERCGGVVGERAGAEGLQVAADSDLDTVGDGDTDDLALVLADLQLGVVGAGDDHATAPSWGRAWATGKGPRSSSSRIPRWSAIHLLGRACNFRTGF